MTSEDRAILLEAHETMLEAYRTLAIQIAERNIPAGFARPIVSPESAYCSQLHVGALGCTILTQVLPILDVIHALAKQTGGIEMLINRELARFDTDMEVDYFPDLSASLMRAVSKVATANGLPPCCFTKNEEAACPPTAR